MAICLDSQGEKVAVIESIALVYFVIAGIILILMYGLPKHRLGLRKLTTELLVASIFASVFFFLLIIFIGLMKPLAPNLAIVLLFYTSNTILAIIYDPVATVITILVIAYLLCIVEIEYHIVYHLRLRFTDWLELKQSERLRRKAFEEFRQAVKNGEVDRFEQGARRVIK